MEKNPTKGIYFSIMAFLFWGLTPLYWKQFSDYPLLTISSHRVIWAVVFLLPLLWIQGGLSTFYQSFRPSRTLFVLLISSLLAGLNGYLVVWAVSVGKTLEVSLGYFLCPLVSVLLGVFFLKEKLAIYETLATFCAFFGVAAYSAQYQDIPWIGISLSIVFAFYGFIRKTVSMDSTVGLVVENCLLSFLALPYLFFAASINTPGTTIVEASLLVGSGVVTVLPFLWFVIAVRNLPLSKVGFFQYLAPTCQFLIAVFINHEPFSNSRLISFAFIWAALAVSALGPVFKLQRN